MRTFAMIGDGLVALGASFGMLVAGWLSVGVQPVMPFIAQQLNLPAIPAPNESVWEFAIRQGGAFVILLIILFYYRRDYRELVAYRTERDNTVTELVKEATRASTEVAAALRESNIIMHQAKNVMREYLPALDQRRIVLPIAVPDKS